MYKRLLSKLILISLELNFNKLSYLINIILQYMYFKQDAVWERNMWCASNVSEDAILVSIQTTLSYASVEVLHFIYITCTLID